jgi:hypothetical protein
VPRHDHHPAGADHIRNRREHSDLEIRAVRRGPDDLRQPESERVKGDRNREVHDREQPDAPARKSAADAADEGRAREALVLFAAQRFDERGTLVIGKPAGVFRVLGHVEEHHDPQHNGRQPLE